MEKSRRVAPRYHHQKQEPIQVHVVQLFSPRQELEGSLYDLTPEAIKVRLPKEHRSLMNHYVLKSVLLSFRLKKNQSVTVSKGFLMRNDSLDEKEGGFASVFMFDLLMEPDREAIAQLCEEFAAASANEPSS